MLSLNARGFTSSLSELEVSWPKISILSLAPSQVGGGTFNLHGDLWVKNTFDVQANRDLTVRSGMAATHSRKSNNFPHTAPAFATCRNVNTPCCFSIQRVMCWVNTTCSKPLEVQSVKGRLSTRMGWLLRQNSMLVHPQVPRHLR